ncbi:MAG: nucleotidyltransferase domain-containing protein [Candidatus Berkelbacteria bacterium]
MNEFEKSASLATAKILEDADLKSEIKLVALLGSTADGEAVPHYSDVDLLVIPNNDDNGRINHDVIVKLKAIATHVSSVNEVKLSILTFTIDDLETFVDEEFLTHFSWRKTTYSKNDDTIQSICNSILAKRKVTAEKMQALVVNDLRKMRFDLIRKYISQNEFNSSGYIRAFGREFIDKLFEISDRALIFDGIWSKTKKEVMENIVSNYKDKFDTTAMQEVYAMRSGWNEATDAELEDCFERWISYVNSVIAHTISKVK